MFIEQDFGGKVTCSQCGATLTVRPKAGSAPEAAPVSVPDDEYRIAPADGSKPPPAKAPADSAADNDFALAPLDSGNAAAVTGSAAIQASGRRCPNCDVELAPGAVLCIQCGYDFRQGVKMRGVVGRRGPVLGVLHSQNAIPLCSGAGFLLGVAAALVLTLIFGVIWVGELIIYSFVGAVLGIVIGGGIGYALTPLLPRASSGNASDQLGGMLRVIGGMFVTGVGIMSFGALYGRKPSGPNFKIVYLIYEFLGEWGVLIILGGAGLTLIVMGIRQMLPQEE
jgi:hypothetical protein